MELVQKKIEAFVGLPNDLRLLIKLDTID